MIAAGVALLLITPRIGISLIIGGFLATSFPQFFDLWRDRRYGKFRPSLKEIDRMSSEEYRKKLADPKFRKWVNHFPPAKESPWESISRNP